MSGEVWKQLPGYGGHYEVSDMGNVRVKDKVVRRKHSTGGMADFAYKGRLLKLSKSGKWGHLSVSIGVDGKCFSLAVHRLVLLTFVGPCPDGMEACHNNGIAGDNRLQNLRWDTHRANNADRKRHGNYAIGEAHKMAKLTEEIVRQIKRANLNGTETARMFGIGTSTAHRIRTGKSWAHINV